MVGPGHVHAVRSIRDPHGVVSCLGRATRDRLRVVSPGPRQLRAPAKLLREPGAGMDPGTPSGHAFAVGLVSPGSEPRHSNLLISRGDGALTEGARGTAATLPCQDTDFWLAWVQASRGDGLPSIRAASTVPEPTLCPCRWLDVPSPGQAKPQH